MGLFRSIKLEGSFWGVFLANPIDNDDRYLVSSTFEIEQEAENLTMDFNRIAEEADKVVLTPPIPVLKLNTKRRIQLAD